MDGMGCLLAFRGKAERLTISVVFELEPTLMVFDIRIFTVLGLQYLLILVVPDEEFNQQRFICVFENLKHFAM
jgi:hypothetical protein